MLLVLKTKTTFLNPYEIEIEMVSYYYNRSIENRQTKKMHLFIYRLNKGLKVKILSSYYQQNSKKTSLIRLGYN